MAGTVKQPLPLALLLLTCVLTVTVECCPEERRCFPDDIVQVTCQSNSLPEWTNEPSIIDCSMYVTCINGVGIQMCCPVGDYFNPTTLVCDDAGNVECNIEPPPCTDPTTTEATTSPTPEVTTRPEETTTTIETTTTPVPEITTTTEETTTTSETTPEPTTLDPEPTTTSPEETTTLDPGGTTPLPEDTTTLDPEVTTELPGTTTTNDDTTTVTGETTTVVSVDLDALCARQSTDGLLEVAYPGQCHQYVICADRELVGTETCPAGLHFNPILLVCDSPDTAECTEHICRDNPEGSQVPMKSVNTCEIYYICVGSIAIVRQCAPGTIYDPNNDWCIGEDLENPCVVTSQ
ncbi:mucin-2-like [Anopheles cruzii]|uniref:mucin-2-like n=1 Tax=Anopheles cruzii TaxID=68878 RepID=UPI0022EC6422|nr:mucin-2-like [Anopheles cruzii]